MDDLIKHYEDYSARIKNVYGDCRHGKIELARKMLRYFEKKNIAYIDKTLKKDCNDELITLISFLGFWR